METSEAVTLHTATPVNDTTPSLHPMERKQLLAESTLIVTVKPSNKFHSDVTDGIGAPKRSEAVNFLPTLSFTSYDDLMQTLTPRVLDLIEAIGQKKTI